MAEAQNCSTLHSAKKSINEIHGFAWINATSKTAFAEQSLKSWPNLPPPPKPHWLLPLSAWFLLSCWWSCLNLLVQQKNMTPDTSSAAVAGSAVAAALTGLCHPRAASLHSHRDWRTSPLILFPFPIPCLPQEPRKEVAKPVGQGDGGRWMLTLTVHVCEPVREPDETLLIISGTRDAKFKTGFHSNIKYKIRNCTKLLKRASVVKDCF